MVDWPDTRRETPSGSGRSARGAGHVREGPRESADPGSGVPEAAAVVIVVVGAAVEPAVVGAAPVRVRRGPPDGLVAARAIPARAGLDGAEQRVIAEVRVLLVAR